MKEIEITFYGKVQGVGMRAFLKKKASEYGLDGFVENMDDGSVELLAQGSEESLQAFVEEIQNGPYFARVDDMKIQWHERPHDPINGFTIER